MTDRLESRFGHVVVEKADGPVYKDDDTPFDAQNPRSCRGCGVKCVLGQQDPCISDLLDTASACCGHGLYRYPGGKKELAGYVTLKDGRFFQFSGRRGGKRIRLAVEAAIAGRPLPSWFKLIATSWWYGLTEAQRKLGMPRVQPVIARLVEEATGQPAPPFSLVGEQQWSKGMTKEQKQYVLDRLDARLLELREQVLKELPDQGAE